MLRFQLVYNHCVSSLGSNVRVWNLSNFDSPDTDKSSRPAYEDIANTQDTKNIVPGYAFGGTYEFAIVRIDAPKEANRDAFYMPEKVCEEDNGLRRRRYPFSMQFSQRRCEYS